MKKIAFIAPTGLEEVPLAWVIPTPVSTYQFPGVVCALATLARSRSGDRARLVVRILNVTCFPFVLIDLPRMLCSSLPPQG